MSVGGECAIMEYKEKEKMKHDPLSDLGYIDEMIADCERNHYCPICGRPMLWFVDTLLCPVCDKTQLAILKYDDMVRKGTQECD